jgi:hypothetical protein
MNRGAKQDFSYSFAAVKRQ